MSSISGDESIQWDTLGSSTNEEKIFVAVRLRPLNDKEVGRNDVSEWECINNNTIILKNGLPERSMFPTAYTFDRVFASECSTEQVYEEGPKKVALSVVSGINTSIFAYGQTSSGKTYTMRGITVYTMADIFDYVHRHNDREFVLKFSAMEIYNESVRDLLGSDSTPLRLLDDPERGTVVEKLTEVSLRDWSHLEELLDVCEAERQIGETSLNAMSSRSHQIIRVTVESSAREFLGAENSSTLAATVVRKGYALRIIKIKNFIDLAGSERASQTLSAGSRLKEGSHINRSLLTLGTVIRKLSKGKNGHVPYRNSKLTRILQNSLGGNARTAIICTMSPAHSHVEQSRNTLLFAVCAKEVRTNAQVNVVMSEKALVKQLQRELARLESELRSLQSISTMGNPASLLKEKECLIEKMDTEIRYLTQQRDLAESRVKEMQRSTSDNQVLRRWVEADNLSDTHERGSRYYENSISDTSEVVDPRLDFVSNTSHLSDRSHGLNTIKNDPRFPDHSEEQFLSDGSSPSEFMNKYFGPDPFCGWEEIVQKNDASSEAKCKEVRCIDIESITDKNIKDTVVSSPSKGDGDLDHSHSDQGDEASKQKIQDMQTTIDDCHVSPYRIEPSPCSSDADISDSRSINLLEHRICREILTTVSSPLLSEKAEQNATPPNEFDIDFAVKAECCHLNTNKSKPDAGSGMVTKDTQDGSDSMDKKEQNTKMSCEVDTDSLVDSATGYNEVLKQKSEMQFDDNTVKEAETNKIESREIVRDDDGLQKVHGPPHGPSDWPLEFERQRKEIIQLWDACSIPLVHRTYFFLLFQGDQSDSVYMEVEVRRLSFLMQTMSLGTSAKVLNREREMLSRQILKKYSAKEREALYQKWGIMLNTKKRRQQLSRRLWKDTDDMDHIKESAALVAKLVGEPGQAPKEIFGLSFAPQHGKSKSSSWKQRRGSFAPY